MEAQQSISLDDPNVQAIVSILRAAGFVVTGLLGVWKVRRDRRHAQQQSGDGDVPEGRSVAERLTAAEVRIVHVEQTQDDLRQTAANLRTVVDNLLLSLAGGDGGEKR